MSLEPPLPPQQLDARQVARIDLAQRIVKRLAAVVGLIMAVALVLGVYNCATDRPAREIFFEPRPAPE